MSAPDRQHPGTTPTELVGPNAPPIATRASALIADALVIALPYNLVVGNALLAALGDLGAFAPFVAFVILAALAAGYFVYFWTRRTATPGMRLFGIAVVGEEGGRLTAPRALTRYLYVGLPIALGTTFATLIPLALDFGTAATLGVLGFASLLLVIASVAWLLLIGLTVARDPRARGVHDRAAASIVRWANPRT